MTKAETYNKMNETGIQRRQAEENRLICQALKPKLEKVIKDLEATKVSLNRTETSLSTGGFLIDGKALDNGKIASIIADIDKIIKNSNTVLTEVINKIASLNTQITSLNNSYNALNTEYKRLVAAENAAKTKTTTTTSRRRYSGYTE